MSGDDGNLEVIKIFFNGREEFLKIYNANGAIIKYLSNVENPVCPLIDTDIKMIKRLGKGKMGEVFEINFPGKGTRRYAVKMALYPETLIDVYAQRALRPGETHTFLDLQNKYGVPATSIISYNKIRAKPEDVITQDIIIPTFQKGCRLKRDTKIPKNDGSGVDVVVEIGDYMCPSSYTEVTNSMLVGELYRSGVSINFLDVFYFATCIQGTNISNLRQYTFMERIDGRLSDVSQCAFEYYLGKDHYLHQNPSYNPDAVDSITIQILHAIAEYQERFKIVHGDLHDANIFLEYVNEDTEWNLQKVIEADYYTYKIDTQTLYVSGGKRCPFIVKIGDLGLACKYSKPRVLDELVMSTGYDQGDGFGPWIPNFYSAAYDVIHVLLFLYSHNPSNELIKGIVAWILDLVTFTDQELEAAFYEAFNMRKEKVKNRQGEEEYVYKGPSRPRIDLLDTRFSKVSAKNILTNDLLVGKFKQRPDYGEGVVFGVL